MREYYFVNSVAHIQLNWQKLKAVTFLACCISPVSGADGKYAR